MTIPMTYRSREIYCILHAQTIQHFAIYTDRYMYVESRIPATNTLHKYLMNKKHVVSILVLHSMTVALYHIRMSNHVDASAPHVHLKRIPLVISIQQAINNI